MRQLKYVDGTSNHQMIEHLVVMVDVNKDPDSYSTLKFGSWDQSALSGTLFMFATASRKSWAINADSITYDGHIIMDIPKKIGGTDE
jgi:hypothetical protein